MIVEKQRDQLLAAIEYTLAVADGKACNSDEIDAVDWLRDWTHGEQTAMAELDRFIEARDRDQKNEKATA